MTYPDHLSMHYYQKFYYENQRHLLQALDLALVLVLYQRFRRLFDRRPRYGCCCCCCGCRCCCRGYFQKLHHCWIENHDDDDDETMTKMMSWLCHCGRCDGDDGGRCDGVLVCLNVPRHYHCHLTALFVSPGLVLAPVPVHAPVLVPVLVPVPDYAFDPCLLVVVVKIVVVILVVVMMTVVLSLLLSLLPPTTTSSLLPSHYLMPSYCEYSPYSLDHLFVTPSHQSHISLNLPLHSPCSLLEVTQQYQRFCYPH